MLEFTGISSKILFTITIYLRGDYMIGNFLKQKRLAVGLTQEFVARQLNISRQAISNWENGSRDINIRDLIAYAKILEISFEDLEVHVNHIDGNNHQGEYCRLTLI